MKKKLMAVLLTFVMAFTATITAYATPLSGGGSDDFTLLVFDSEEEIQAYIASTVESEGMIVVSQETTIDENGDETVSTFYRTPPSRLRGAYGSGHFVHTKDATINIGTTTYYVNYLVSGDFTWNSMADTATVSNAGGACNVEWLGITAPSAYISYFDTESKSNQGTTFLLGRKYAYARLSFDVAFSGSSVTRSYSAYIDVNVDGSSTRR